MIFGGKLINNPAQTFSTDTFRVPVKKRFFGIFGAVEYIDIDVCGDCLKLLCEKAKEVQKNENNS